jgi:hypothetical protein
MEEPREGQPDSAFLYGLGVAEGIAAGAMLVMIANVMYVSHDKRTPRDSRQARYTQVTRGVSHGGESIGPVAGVWLLDRPLLGAGRQLVNWTVVQISSFDGKKCKECTHPEEQVLLTLFHAQRNMNHLEAAGWGVLSASSFPVGCLVGLVRSPLIFMV